MSLIRLATITDAKLITGQRHRMFADAKFASEERLCELDRAFEPWLRTQLADGRYIGWLVEENGSVIAGAGLYLMEFPPHFLDTKAVRAYLLNFYTEPAYRGRGYARQLLELSVAESRTRGIVAVTLHASQFGKPIYEKAGFSQTNEMMLRLE
jgi:GNAT superfamily N-acetyltransferase